MWPTGETQNSLQIFSHFWEEVKSLVSLSTRRAGTHSTPKEKVQGPAQGDRCVGRKKNQKKTQAVVVVLGPRLSELRVFGSK